MGTKANPGQFDCYTKAKDDEPMFVLLARDPRAPFLVDLWGHMQSGDIFGAIEVLHNAAQHPDVFATVTSDVDRKKASEAYSCAENMRTYREEHHA